MQCIILDVTCPDHPSDASGCKGNYDHIQLYDYNLVLDDYTLAAAIN